MVDAFRLGDEYPGWFHAAVACHDVITHNYDGRHSGGPDYAIIMTLEGEMRANKGDWIVRGIKGEIYPVRPDIFAMTYEPAE